MANYSLSVNSTFQPFSYQELATPIDRQDAYFEKLTEEYDKLSSQADILEAMGQNDRDKNSRTYARYKAYSDSLRKEADDLYRFGLNSESRQRLSDLRRMYNTEIVRIQNAWNKRKQEADLQMNARIQHPELKFTRDAANTSLDEYIRNPEGGFGVVNLNNVAAQMSEAAKNLAKQARTGRLEGIDEYTKNFITPYGLDPNLVNDWQNNPEKSPTLTSMMNQVLAANGLSGEEFLNTPNGARILQEAIGAARRGAWSAVGDDKAQVIEDFASRLAAKTAAEIDAYQKKKQIDAAAAASGESAGLPGDTFDINFNDPESAGNAMKHSLATATYNFLKGSKTPSIRALVDKYGSKEEAIQHFETEGIDGNELKKAGVYYSLGNHIRNNVTRNEDIINIWRSGMAKEAKAPISSSDSYRQNTYQGLDMFGNPISEEVYNDTRRVPGAGTQAGVRPGTKDWKNINELSSTGYKVKAIQLNDQSTALKGFLERTLDRNYRDGKVKLYDIKKIKGDGTYEYGETTKVEDLPHTTNGKEIDYGRIRRAMLTNGDYLLYWKDDKGQTQEKVLRRSDIGEQAVRDWQNTDTGYKSALNLYTQGKITKEQFNELARRFGVNNMANAYLDTQEVKVKDYELQ